MTKLAEFAPPWCAGCYEQNLERRHVDFEAAYDGPVLEGVDAATKPQIDDLILCEECLRDGAKVLGWETDDVSSELERLERELERVTTERDELAEYVDKQEALIARGRDMGRIAKPKGRPIKKPEVLNASPGI